MIVGDTIELPRVSLSHVWYCHREGHIPIEAKKRSFSEIKLPIPHNAPVDSFWADWVCIDDAVEDGLVPFICYYLGCKVDDPRTKYPSGMLHKLYGHSASYVGW